MTWDYGDRTLIQVDHSSITPDNTNVEVMTCYRFLTHLERVKRITAYKLSYSDCERKPSGAEGGDGFTLKVKDPHKYRLMSESSSSSSTCKSFFATCSLEELKKSEMIQKVFRWRFERTWQCCKVAKPYVISSKAIQLKAKEPTQIM